MAVEVMIGGTGKLFIGEDKTLRFEILDAAGLPVDMTGWTLLFDVRLSDASPDPALLSKTPTVSGVYAATRAANAQRALVTLSDTELNTLKARTYRYSCKRMDSGSEVVLAWGNFVIQKATAP